MGRSIQSATLDPLVPDDVLLRMHSIMMTARVLEERLIHMQRKGHGYFWIGGPGEEAFNTALGLLVNKGRGLDHDYLHLHYRSSATLLAMGADPVDSLRMMASRATDPYGRGRNFAGHYSVRAWNVSPVSSPIEVQFSIAIGTAIAQRRHGGRGITIVQGGDAGTAEGDFATALVWSGRPEGELPLLMIVTNNEWGISTHASTVQGARPIAGRGTPFGIRTMLVDGNDAVASYRALGEALEYVRSERRPLLLEAAVSRMYGHSSSSGANRDPTVRDCVAELEERLVGAGLLSAETAAAEREATARRFQQAMHEVLAEPVPDPASIRDFVFAERNVVAEGG